MLVNVFYKLIFSFFKKKLKLFFKYFLIKDGFIKIFSNYCLYFSIFNFLSKSTFFQLKNLVDLVIIDYPNKNFRFLANYLLLSINLNFRLTLHFCTSDSFPIISTKKIFNSSNWLEREAWDFYGIFFIFNNDLRRIFLDYGFEGYPFRKDFPLSGFYEIYYNQPSYSLCYRSVIINKT